MIDLYQLKVLPGETVNPHRKAFIASPEAGSRFVYQRSFVNPASCSASTALIRKSSFPALESSSSCLSQRACSNSINHSRSFEIEELNHLPKQVHSRDWPLKRVHCTISCGGTSWVVIYGWSRRGLGLSGWLGRWELWEGFDVYLTPDLSTMNDIHLLWKIHNLVIADIW